ncbi:hypothetical protein L1987_53642 [Smallanthus sonchifolius]|uniref:Uncharacterized protein n=2 Tax=Smallanthus sonchifolius TaxID=185202 RepID=A0ACB9EWF0_9ASTR|nr:hypothetical protein L1987_53641 [Smallanthus sonchifolius]KAI3763190.1 hypothetical protein L1987_53642 [Smallanthus sonchifolius]
MEINKFLLFSVSLVLILGVVESFEYHEKELETEEGLQAMYDRWRDHHKVKERSPDRFNVFKHNVQHVHNTNKMNKPYKLEVNQFAAMTSYEFVRTYANSKIGHKMKLRGNSPGQDPRYMGFTYENQTDLPRCLDWREKGMVAPIKSQGACGSCWAFAAVSTVETLNAIRTGQLVTLSEQQLVDCDSLGTQMGCDGGIVHEVFVWITEHGGLATDASYPYEGHRHMCDPAKFGHHTVTLDGQEEIPGLDELAVMKAVANGAVTIGMDPTGDDFMLYKEGVYTLPGGSESMHAMTLVGWGETPEGLQYWIVRNSWGDWWGEKGYIKMQRGPGAPQPWGTCVMYGHPAMPRKTPNCPPNHPC